MERLPWARRALTVGAVALVWSSAGASPALAREFSIALVTAAGSRSSPDAADVQAGWRLAVDQSPDVSHPAGPDAGDHLGGIDVRVTAVDGGDPAAAGARIRTQRQAPATVPPPTPSVDRDGRGPAWLAGAALGALTVLLAVAVLLTRTRPAGPGRRRR